MKQRTRAMLIEIAKWVTVAAWVGVVLWVVGEVHRVTPLVMGD